MSNIISYNNILIDTSSKCQYYVTDTIRYKRSSLAHRSHDRGAQHHRLELVLLQQQTRNMALSQRIRSWILPPSINNMHAFKATTSSVSSRQTKATSGADGGNHQALKPRRLPRRQPLPNVEVTGTALGTRTHAHGIPVWICYRVATHQLNLYFPRRESKNHLACAEQHKGLLHIL